MTEDIDVKNQLGTTNLRDPLSIREAVSNFYVDDKFNNPSNIKNLRICWLQW